MACVGFAASLVISDQLCELEAVRPLSNTFVVTDRGDEYPATQAGMRKDVLAAGRSHGSGP